MEKPKNTKNEYVLGTSDLSKIDFLWPWGPQGSQEGPQGGLRGAQSAFRHPYARLAHPIGHRGAMSHDTVGTHVVHLGVSQAAL